MVLGGEDKRERWATSIIDSKDSKSLPAFGIKCEAYLSSQ